MTKPRIGIYYSFPGGGIGRYNSEWLRALSSQVEASLEFVSLPEFEWDETIACEHWPNLFSISSPIVPWRRAKFLIGQVVNPRRAIRHLSQAGAEIIHFTDVNHLSYPFWRRALDRSGMKMVVTAHDVRRQVAVLNRAYEDNQLKAVYQRADAILVHADAQVDELVEFAGVDRSNIVVVPHGPYSYGSAKRSKEEVRAAYGFGQDERVGLCFGQLRDEKNLEALMGALQQGGVKSKLLVAGRAGHPHKTASDYARLASELGVGDRVVFDDRFIPDNEVADLVEASDWIGVPYRSDFTSMSGVLNLACHYRRPVLCGSAPALSQAVRQYKIGRASSGDDADDLREALAKLEDDLIAREGLAEGFENFLEVCSWNENASRTHKVYQRLLAAK